MHRIIILLIALVVYTELLFSQEKFDSRLLDLEKEIFSSTSDTVKAKLRFCKLNLYISDNNFSLDALAEAKRTDYSLLDKKLQADFLWNVSLLSYLSNEKDKALSYFNNYIRMTSDSTIQSEILNILIKSNYDSAYVRKKITFLSLKDSSLCCLSCLNTVNEYKLPHKSLYIASSAIIPGLGTMMNGNIFQGISSLLVNTITGYGTYLLFRSNLYANAFLFGGALFYKFYTGNLRLTQKKFEVKEARKKNTLANDCKRKLKKILEKYPLTFR